MNFWKLHALGNHFVFVIDEGDIDYPQLAKTLCRSRLGIGSDGLLSIDRAGDIPMVRMWNPDGTEDFCGNGLCCAAHLLAHLGLGPVTRLATPGRIIPAQLGPLDGARSRAGVALPRATFDWAQIPLDPAHGRPEDGFALFDIDGAEVRTISLNNGNMHSIIPVDHLPGDPEFQRMGPLIENHPIFPHRTNVVWCVVADDGLQLRIWERGVGETLSCGTGAAAAVEACFRAGLISAPSMSVSMTGGKAEVTIAQENVVLSTIAEIVFSGRVSAPDGIGRLNCTA